MAWFVVLPTFQRLLDKYRSEWKLDARLRDVFDRLALALFGAESALMLCVERASLPRSGGFSGGGGEEAGGPPGVSPGQSSTGPPGAPPSGATRSRC